MYFLHCHQGSDEGRSVTAIYDGQELQLKKIPLVGKLKKAILLTSAPVIVFV